MEGADAARQAEGSAVAVTLTAAELRALTGKVRCDAQRRVLERLGLRYAVRPDGSVAVLRSHVEAKLGGTIQAREPELHL